MSASTAVPTTLLREVVTSSHGGSVPQLPLGSRTEAVAWLIRVLIREDAWQLHLAELRHIMNLPPTPRLPASSQHLQRGLDALYLQFPRAPVLSDDVAFVISERGLDAASDETLAELLVNPGALDFLRTLINDELSEIWVRERKRSTEDPM